MHIVLRASLLFITARTTELSHPGGFCHLGNPGGMRDGETCCGSPWEDLRDQEPLPHTGKRVERS